MTDPSRALPLTRSSVVSAQRAIEPYIHRTPVLTSRTLNAIASTPQKTESLVGTPWEGQPPAHPKINLFFKCENFQRIGAFKIRGASHALSRLSKEELKKGVVTHSSGLLPMNHPRLVTRKLRHDTLTQLIFVGNHAQALALAAKHFNTTAHIVMPTISTPSKIAATKGYGAHVYLSGSTSDEREAVVKDVIAKTGAVLIPPYDHPDIILGQGTMGLEMEEQVAELVANDPTLSVHHKHQKQQQHNHHHHLNALICPLGGGGMLAGLATALQPTGTKIFGAEPTYQGADDGVRGLATGTRITKVSSLTIADGLRTPVGKTNWGIISHDNDDEDDGKKRYVEGVYGVTEEGIRAAMKLLMERLKVVVEPSACVGLAVVLFDEGFRRKVEMEMLEEEEGAGWDIGFVLSGGNVGVEGLVGIFGPGGGSREEEDEEEVVMVKTGKKREVGEVGLDGVRNLAEIVAG